MDVQVGSDVKPSSSAGVQKKSLRFPRLEPDTSRTRRPRTKKLVDPLADTGLQAASTSLYCEVISSKAAFTGLDCEMRIVGLTFSHDEKSIHARRGSRDSWPEVRDIETGDIWNDLRSSLALLVRRCMQNIRVLG